MAREVGILPLVRYWSLGKHWDQASALKDYRAKIGAVVADLQKTPGAEAHWRGLQASMLREKAQGLPAGEGTPQPVLQQVEDINKALDDAGHEDAKKLIADVTGGIA
jgi:hypothetical protein